MRKKFQFSYINITTGGLPPPFPTLPTHEIKWNALLACQTITRWSRSHVCLRTLNELNNELSPHKHTHMKTGSPTVAIAPTDGAPCWPATGVKLPPIAGHTFARRYPSRQPCWHLAAPLATCSCSLRPACAQRTRATRRRPSDRPGPRSSPTGRGRAPAHRESPRAMVSGQRLCQDGSRRHRETGVRGRVWDMWIAPAGPRCQTSEATERVAHGARAPTR